MRTKDTALIRDLGVTVDNNRVVIYSNSLHNGTSVFRAGVSQDGLSFKTAPKQPQILLTNGKIEDTRYCQDFFITNIEKYNYLIYKKQLADTYTLNLARAKNYYQWQFIAKIDDIQEKGSIIPSKMNSTSKQLNLIYGETEIKIGYLDDKFKITNEQTILSPRQNAFDKFPLEIGGVFTHENGVLVIYFVKTPRREGEQYSAGAALLDKNDLTKILWRSDNAIWEQPEDWNNMLVYPLGALHFKDNLLFYFGIENKSVVAVSFKNYNRIFSPKRFFPSPTLSKHKQNPIITPVMHHSWENQSTFNAAAVYDDEKIHLIYRAQGDANTSVLGYANTTDGYNIDERSEMPVYVPREPFETPWRQPFKLTKQYMSGGGYGGCEDPKITKIDNRFYLTYVAFNGIDPPRVAISSIEVEEFRQQTWNWSPAKLISPPNVIDKSAVLFPEKVNGKYVMMHRIFPNLLIDFLDDLNFNEYLEGKYKIEPRENMWDSRKLSAGAPPIKTKDGWLLIYHAVDDRDDKQYKVGAMLLDLNDPTKVKYRSLHPILTPTEWYENEGFKGGIAYPCGAVVLNGELMVYYGGADTVVCVATKNLNEFLKELKESSPITLQTVPNHQFITTDYEQK